MLKVTFLGMLIVGTALATPALAQSAPPLAITLPATQTAGTLTVTSATYKSGAAIPLDNSSYGKSNSPQVTWTAGPGTTKSYVVLMEDPDAQVEGKPIIHWVAYDIPGSVTSLPENLPKEAAVANPKGMMQGMHVAKGPGYFGPKPPLGASAHHYHLEVFAVDKVLGLAAGATREDVLGGISGHVLAKGELVGLYTPAAK